MNMILREIYQNENRFVAVLGSGCDKKIFFNTMASTF